MPWAQLVLIIGVFTLTFLLPLRSSRFSLTPTSKPILALFAFFFIMAMLQSINQKTIFTAPFFIPFTLCRLDTLDFAAYLISLWGIFVATTQIFGHYRYIKRYAIFITFTGILTALIGFSSVRGEYINFFTGVGLLKETFGPFVNRNHAAVFLNLCFFAALAWGAPYLLAAKNQQDISARKEELKKFLSPFVAMVILGGAIIFTRSRGGILAFTSGLFTYAFILGLVMIKNIKYKIAALVLLIGLFIGLAAAVDNNVEDINRFARRDGENWGFSVETRKNLYNAGYFMLLDYKPFGVGLNSLPNGIYPYLDKPVKAYIEHIHNDWLEIITGSGFTGGIVLLLCLLWLAAALYREGKTMRRDKLLSFAALVSGLAAMSAGSCFDFHFFIPSNAVLFFITAGLVASPAFAEKYKQKHMPKYYCLFAAILFLPFIVFSYNKTLAWRYYSFSAAVNGKTKIEYLQRSFEAYPHPRTALRLAIANYNMSNRNISHKAKAAYRARAAKLSGDYLKKYPLYKELLNVYNKSSAQ